MEVCFTGQKLPQINNYFWFELLYFLGVPEQTKKWRKRKTQFLWQSQQVSELPEHKVLIGEQI